jgi:hypothetical protein
MEAEPAYNQAASDGMGSRPWAAGTKKPAQKYQPPRPDTLRTGWFDTSTERRNHVQPPA